MLSLIKLFDNIGQWPDLKGKYPDIHPHKFVDPVIKLQGTDKAKFLMKILIGLLVGALHARYAENDVGKQSSEHQVAKSSKVNVNFAPKNTNYQSWVNVNTEIETEVEININSPDCSDSKEDKEEPKHEVTNWFDKLKGFLDNWSECNDCVDLRDYIRDFIKGDKVLL